MEKMTTFRQPTINMPRRVLFYQAVDYIATEIIPVSFDVQRYRYKAQARWEGDDGPEEFYDAYDELTSFLSAGKISARGLLLSTPYEFFYSHPEDGGQDIPSKTASIKTPEFWTELAPIIEYEDNEAVADLVTRFPIVVGFDDIAPQHWQEKFTLNASNQELIYYDKVHKKTNMYMGVSILTADLFDMFGYPNEYAAIDKTSDFPANPNLEQPTKYKTGMPGRPTVKHLIEGEFRRRVRMGEFEPTLSAEASHLREWAAKTHPKAPTPTQKTIKNNIRHLYNAVKSKP